MRQEPELSFSIIVPAYEAHEIIARGIDSVVGQDFPSQQWELVIVDDCSSESSFEALQNLTAKYSGYNIRLLRHTENTRQGGARNTGIRAAHGKWLMFMDADDCWVCSNVLSQFAALIKDDSPDLIRSAHYTGLRQASDCIAPGRADCEIIRKFDNGREAYYTNLMAYEVWSSVYRRDFLLSNALFFEEHMFYEDTDWNVRMVYFSKKSIYVDFPFYGYVNNPQSTTKVMSSRLLEDNIRSHYILHELINDIKNEDAKFSNRLERNATRSLIRLALSTRNFRISDSVMVLRRHKRIFREADRTNGFSESLLRYMVIFSPSILVAMIHFLTWIKRCTLRLSN